MDLMRRNVSSMTLSKYWYAIKGTSRTKQFINITVIISEY